MLEQEELVADPALGALGDEALLERRAPRGSPPARATTRRSAPARGSTRSGIGGQCLDRHDGTIAGQARSGRLGPDRCRPSPSVDDRHEAARARRSAPPRTRPPAAASWSRAARRHGSTSRRPASATRIRPARPCRGSPPARRRSGRRPQRGQREEPRTNSGTARRSARPRAGATAIADLVAVASAQPRRGDQEQQRRHERVADELDDGRHVERLGPVGGAGGDDLARVVDGDAGPQARTTAAERPSACPIVG